MSQRLMTKQIRRPLEDLALITAKPLIEEIYGEFEIIPDVVDRPDAAIKTKKEIKAGIEITTIDDPEYLKNVNISNKKIQKLVQKEMENKNQDFTILSKRRVHIVPDYIGKMICMNKNPKLYSYKKINNFEEYAVVMHTQIFDLTNESNGKYQAYHFAHALEYSLRKYNLLYNHAILVNAFSGKGLRIYNKNAKIHPTLKTTFR